MGTWGRGNFDSDDAAEHLSVVIDRLVAEVAEAMDGDPAAIGPDEYWGAAVPCNLELLYVLARAGYKSDHPLHPETVEEWKRKFMAVWERTIDSLWPVQGFKEGRRLVLNRSFDQLAKAAADQARQSA